MYAVIETGGKQYRVAPGTTVKVESLAGEPGADFTFDKVVAVVNEAGEVSGGAGAKVTAKIDAHGRGEKVIVFKFKRKKQYKKTIGHRQNFTQVTVTGIEA
ncbi:MAG: 50S ribosomal protein L21 [Acidobacteria bacterium]|nr:50S ribosomal protein L21 [Acidobacteriota bacterium]MBM3769483.1 50S ribosomal protein L21 [Acidobacteriota bacterium]